VQSLVNKTLKNKIEVEEVLGMENPNGYRNKLQYPLGIDKTGNPVMGVFASRTHEIIPVEKCFIQNPEIEKVAKFIFEFIVKNKISIYNEKTQKGLIRHIVIKIGVKTNEVMCIIVINGKSMPKEKELVDELINNFQNVKSIIKNINMKNTNVILGNENINLYGDGYIKDILGDYTFKISAMSFYQVNPYQAERLYNIGIEAGNITKEDVVFDLYCGIGTISLFMSKYAKKVYGVEIVKEAIDMANENAKINRIDNLEFFAGDAKEIVDDLINNKNIIPDVIMVDPPRKGLDNTTIENILKIHPKKIVYISCNPATMVRDLAKFEEKYSIEKIKPVDMFPYTSSVECVSCLELKH
jgi:23S rRNA (uracil1939-C5)-methyltransferase